MDVDQVVAVARQVGEVQVDAVGPVIHLQNIERKYQDLRPVSSKLIASFLFRQKSVLSPHKFALQLPTASQGNHPRLTE